MSITNKLANLDVCQIICFLILSIIENILNVNYKIESFLNNIKRGDFLTLYDRIKKLADEKNMSIAYIEESVHISNGSIAKWKQNVPKVDNLYKVAKFLGCSVEFLMTDEHAVTTGNDFESEFVIKESIVDYKSFLSENEVEILDILKKFTDNRNQIKFIARVEALAEEMLANLEANKK